MNTNDVQNTEDVKTYHVRVKGFTNNKIAELSNYLSMNVSQTIIHAINEFYSKMKPEMLGYHTGSKTAHKKRGREAKADAQSDAVEFMKSLSDEDLSKYLITIGFSDPNKFTDEREVVEARYEVRTSPEGNREYWIVHIDLTSGEESYRAKIYSWDELVAALKKSKKI